MNVTYTYLTHGKTQAQRREVDVALAGPEGEPPANIAAANRQAMTALGGFGVGKAPNRKGGGTA